MALLLAVILVFLVTLGLTLTGLYLFFAARAGRKVIDERVKSYGEVPVVASADSETRIIAEQVLSNIPILNRILVQIRPLLKLNLFLQQSGAKITVGALLALSLAVGWVGALVVVLSGLPAWMGAAVGAACAACPFVVLSVRRQRRFQKFGEVFPEAIDLLARAVRAGHAFMTGFQLVAEELPDPVALEFRRTFEQQNIGIPIPDALRNLALRMPTPDVRVFVTALVIQRQAGGNLAEVLDSLSKLIRERFTLMRQIKVFTAQGRMSLYVLISLPPLSALALYAVNPNYMSLLFTDPMGHKALATAGILQAIGYFVIRKIVQPKV